MNRAIVMSLCCTALAFGLACGKYGRPERIAPQESAVSAAAQDVENGDAEERDEKKSSKR